MSSINVEESDLQWATQQGLITETEASRLWQALVQRTADRGGLNLAQLAFYSGALLVMFAFTMMVLESSVLLFLLFGGVGLKLWYHGPAKYGIPQVVGGLFVTVAVVLSPVITTVLLSFFPDWLISEGDNVELTVLIFGCVALYYVRFPFLTVPISVALFFSLYNLVILWHDPTSDQINYLAFGFGLAMDIAAFFVDRQKFKQDFGCWLYLFGTLIMYGALSEFIVPTISLEGDFIVGPYYWTYGVFCVVKIVLACALNRRRLVVFGAIGEACHLLWLSTYLYYDSIFYHLVLTGMGIFIIIAGIQIQKLSNRWPSASSKEVPMHPIYSVLPASVPNDVKV